MGGLVFPQLVGDMRVLGDDTNMGDSKPYFTATQWNQIEEAQTGDADKRNRVLNGLIQRYWKPVYVYLRKKGNDNEAAKDLTQGFFTEIVFGRDLLARADASQGRFRTFLLSALDNYVRDMHRRGSAQKRMPEHGIASLDAIQSGITLDRHAQDPQEAFQFAWASDLVERALADFEAQCRADGQAALHVLFMKRVAGPILEGVDPPSLIELCEQLGIEGQQKASNLLVTAKRRFRACIKRRVLDLVGSQDLVDAEIDEIMLILSRGARS